MTLTEKIAAFVSGTRYETLPAEAIAKAKECILDCVGATLGGTTHAAREPVMQYLDDVGGRPDCTIIGTGEKTSVTTAALVNGITGHVLDFDDSTPVFTGHPTVATVAAIFALAEKFGGSGKDIITAYLAGTEVQWKIGLALATHGDHYHKGWHSTGTIGALGAAAAGARMLGLDAEKTAYAIGIVASEAGGFQEQFGTHCKSFHAGRANEGGVRAALLARNGFRSSKTALEGHVGFFRVVADHYDVERISGFGAPWGITDQAPERSMNLKISPVCGGGIGTIENVQYLMRTHGIKAEDVESVECLVQPKELELVPYNDPKTSLEAKFSMHYWVAMTLLEGKVGLAQITDEVVRQPRVRDLTRRIRLIPDPTIPAPPAQMRVKIILRNGQAHQTEYQARRGTARNPMSEQELTGKFMECAALGRYSNARASEALEKLKRLETLGTIAELMPSLLR